MSDRRRLLGPSNILTPNIPTPTPSRRSQTDGTIPQFFIKHSIIENANGSAYLEIGNTLIEVSIFGPRPIRGSFVDHASVSVECKFHSYITPQPQASIYNTAKQTGRTGLTDIEHRMSNYLQGCILPCILLDKYPKSSIDVHVSILSTDREDLQNNANLLWLMNWIVCCCSVAFVDSGIEMRDVITGGQVRLCGDKVIIHPDIQDDEEEQQGCIDGLLNFMNLKNDEIVGIWIESNEIELSTTQMNNLVEECNKMSKIIRANINSYLINSV
ncbi:Exosome complex component MTR3 [Spathaspora sp. JA1]|nr:Exosome complex component MTR3 [Spathaspora sp. JA1]